MKNRLLMVTVILLFIVMTGCSNKIILTETTQPASSALSNTVKPTSGPISTPISFYERSNHVITIGDFEPAEYFYRDFIQIPVGVAWNSDGFLYVADWAGKHIVKIDKDRNMSDMGLWQSLAEFQEDGPRNIVFDSIGNMYAANHGTIFKVSPEGDVEKLTNVHAGPIGGLAVSSNDELYYSDRNGGKIVRWTEGTTPDVIADKLNQVECIVFGHDDTLYASMMDRDGILSIDINTKEISNFAPNITTKIGHGLIYLTVDAEGDLWINGQVSGLCQFSQDGTEKPVIVNGGVYPDCSFNVHTSGGIAFDDEGALWIASYNSRLVRLLPVNPEESDPEFTVDIMSYGFEVSDIALDSDGNIYGSDINAFAILKFGTDFTKETAIQHDSAGRLGVAVDDEGSVYYSKDGNIIKADNDGSQSIYAKGINSMRLVFGTDGILYAVNGRYEQPKTIVAITGQNEYEAIASEIDNNPLGAGDIQLSPAGDNGLYVFDSGTQSLYLMDFEGNGKFVANIAGKGWYSQLMAACPVTENIYFVSNYNLVMLDEKGNVHHVAHSIYGDPWAIEVSCDGKEVYIAESGTIIKIPIS